MNDCILGLGGFDHDGSAALLADGRIVGSLEWERVSRRRYAGLRTFAEVDALLTATGWDLSQVRVIAWADIERFGMPEMMPVREELRRRFPRAEVIPVDHHRCHLASAWYVSGFADGAVLSIDGKGDGASAAIAIGAGDELREVQRQPSSSSLGRTWHALAIACGYSHFAAAGKVMALAGYGEPRFVEDLLAWTQLHADGGFTFTAPGEAHGHGPTFRRAQAQAEFFQDAFAVPRLKPGQLPGRTHADLAASVQAWTTLLVENLASAAVRVADSRNLCMAGGVALNVVANTHILRARVADRLFVQPAAGDSGLALGAALAVNARAMVQPGGAARFSPYLGRSFTDAQAQPGIAAMDGLVCRDCGDPPAAAAAAILRGERIGWFQDREELGPRALGARSLLASPSARGQRVRINAAKGREPYRPLALAVTPAIDRERFEGAACPYMLLSHQVQPDVARRLAEGLHVDGHSRLQRVDEQSAYGFAGLLDGLARAGAPAAVINTSLNAGGEPMVGEPVDAARLVQRGVIDRLFVGGLQVERTGGEIQ